MEKVKLKICFAGEAAVGKTSLIRRFVLNQFDDRYISTFGAKVSKKELEVDTPKGRLRVVLNLWDIMGMKSVRDLLWEAYFHGAQGILAVCDLTRAQTLAGLHAWVSSINAAHAPLPMVLLANKVDLLPGTDELRGPLEVFRQNYGCPYLPTSARNGTNVEEAFSAICQRILRAADSSPVAPET